jgi:hypothetical protein
LGAVEESGLGLGQRRAGAGEDSGGGVNPPNPRRSLRPRAEPEAPAKPEEPEEPARTTAPSAL